MLKTQSLRQMDDKGVYSGYQNWTERAGRFRSIGDGQVDFNRIFAKLTQYGYDHWAVLEWNAVSKVLSKGQKKALIISIAT